MPAARREPAEYRAARGLVVEMERLRVELRREALDAVLVDAHAPGSGEDLAGRKILEIALRHVRFSIPGIISQGPARCARGGRCRVDSASSEA